MPPTRITVEAWIQPADTTQAGPARIISLSTDINYRDFTLGQEGGSYDLRLRTTGTSTNGIPSVSTSGVSTGIQHVVYTRDASGAAVFYINGVQVGTGTVSGQISWDASYKLALANEMSLDRLWQGTFYLAAIYDQALTASQVTQNYDAGRPSGTVLTDTDGDGVLDAADNCPVDANADQTDTDGDGQGDVCDSSPTGDLQCAQLALSPIYWPASNYTVRTDISNNTATDVYIQEITYYHVWQPGVSSAYINWVKGNGNAVTFWNGNYNYDATQTVLTMTRGDLLNEDQATRLVAAGADWDIRTRYDPSADLSAMDAWAGTANYGYRVVVTTDDAAYTGSNGCVLTVGTGDQDDDGLSDPSDNCPAAANSNQADTDGDGAGDACDLTPTGDTDGDGVDNATDNCPTDANASQTDTDGMDGEYGW